MVASLPRHATMSSMKDAVAAASERIHPYIRETPVEECPALGAGVYGP